MGQRGGSDRGGAIGPAWVERLDKADLRGDGAMVVLFVEDRTHRSSSPFEPAVPFPAEFGRLVAVVDVNGDGRDDLLFTGPTPDLSLILLLSRSR